MRAKLYNQFICSSLMLPEHREGLNEYHAEQRRKEEKYVPQVDEQEFEIWDYLVRKSLCKGYAVSVTYLSASGKITLTGVIIAAENSMLRIRDEKTSSIKGINLKDIFSVAEA